MQAAGTHLLDSKFLVCFHSNLPCLLLRFLLDEGHLPIQHKLRFCRQISTTRSPEVVRSRILRSHLSELICIIYRAQSTLTNKSRLKLLQQREEHLQDLFSTARSSIDSLSAADDRYVQFLQSVIIQGLLALLETDVVIFARDKDVEMAQKALENALKQYKEISGRTVNAKVQGGLSEEL